MNTGYRDGEKPVSAENHGKENCRISELIRCGSGALKKNGITDASQDAWLLLEHVSGISRSRGYAHPDLELEPDQANEYKKLISQRAAHIPLQYLTGEAYFMGDRFVVRPGVLIPRQDTERLAEEALLCLKEFAFPKILDLCTGSGCILLSICKERTDAAGVGVELSKKALSAAEENKGLLGVENVRLIQGDVLRTSDFRDFMPGGADLIVSNPPYIPSEILKSLMEEVREHEPREALDGGADGLDFYRHIVPGAMNCLIPGGWLLCEIGFDQGQAVADIYSEAGFADVKILKDYGGLDRVVKGRKERNV